jgi:hypothetical protein
VVESLALNAEIDMALTLRRMRRIPAWTADGDQRAQWTLIDFACPDGDADELARQLAAALAPGRWYTDYATDATKWVVFAGKVFTYCSPVVTRQVTCRLSSMPAASASLRRNWTGRSSYRLGEPDSAFTDFPDKHRRPAFSPCCRSRLYERVVPFGQLILDFADRQGALHPGERSTRWAMQSGRLPAKTSNSPNTAAVLVLQPHSPYPLRLRQNHHRILCSGATPTASELLGLLEPIVGGCDGRDGFHRRHLTRGDLHRTLHNVRRPVGRRREDLCGFRAP